MADKRKKRWFRIAAMVVGLTPFLVFELALQLGGWKPQANAIDDPFIGFSEIRPLFVESAGRLQIAENRQPLFQPDSFAATKPDDEFRIFVVGGSTVQGRPFSIETAFSTWLEINLNLADSTRNWNCINCGGVSYASYRLAPIVEEILNYDPDLIILYTGHNEYLEDRTYQSVKSVPAWVRSVHNWLSLSKSYPFMRELVTGSANSQDQKPQLSSEVEARLDFKDGLQKYHRDDDWRAGIVRHFEFNLTRMANSIQQANVPLIVMNPVANLRHTAPFKSEKVKIDSNTEFNSELIQPLLDTHPRNAWLHFKMGHALLIEDRAEKARQHFVTAKDEDICPLRMTEPLYQVLRSVHREREFSLVDVRAEFEARSENGIPGKELLVDHVHPSIRGHQIIADLLLAKMVESKILNRPGEGFATEQQAAVTTHLESLPFMYFQQGKDRLAGLRRWVEGKVQKQKPSPAALNGKPKPIQP